MSCAPVSIRHWKSELMWLVVDQLCIATHWSPTRSRELREPAEAHSGCRQDSFHWHGVRYQVCGRQWCRSAVCPSHDPQFSELRHVDSTFGTLQPRDEGGVGYKSALIVFHHSGLPFTNVVVALVAFFVATICRVDRARFAERRRASLNTIHDTFIHNKRRLLRLGA